VDSVKIVLTGIYVNDPNAAFRFYTDILGFGERLHIPEALLAIVVSPEEPGGTGLLLEPSDNPIAATYQKQLYDAEIPAIVLGTDDIMGDYARLQGRGSSSATNRRPRRTAPRRSSRTAAAT